MIIDFKSNLAFLVWCRIQDSLWWENWVLVMPSSLLSFAYVHFCGSCHLVMSAATGACNTLLSLTGACNSYDPWFCQNSSEFSCLCDPQILRFCDPEILGFQSTLESSCLCVILKYWCNQDPEILMCQFVGVKLPLSIVGQGSWTCKNICHPGHVRAPGSWASSGCFGNGCRASSKGLLSTKTQTWRNLCHWLGKGACIPGSWGFHLLKIFWQTLWPPHLWSWAC